MRTKTAFSCIALLAAGLVAVAAAQDEPKVDLNTASAEQLQSLPGIGPALAKRITDFREENGPFKKPEDLMNVPGIGEKKFLQLKDRVTVQQPAEAPKPKSPSAN